MSIHLSEGYEVAYPGLKLGVIEEFMPGRGVYMENGNLRAKFPGLIRRDLKKRIIEVLSFKEVFNVRIGDEVVGGITELVGVYGMVRIELINGKILKETITGVVYPTRHLKEWERQYKPGDVIYAVVKSLKNRAIHLSIRGRKYGVISAKCSKCGSMLRLTRAKKRALTCPDCGNEEVRKVSDLYGGLEKLLELVGVK
ncbi:hypothetical protein DRN86_00530 [Candidatus Geothermarchaeota archaeon]|nr:MAG: hypothetical protein DRN86_00530 [Candidatus Geothermarchaeota archaeon]